MDQESPLIPRENFLIPREELSEEQLREALEHCANEPIHIPNCIQPHGVLLVTTGDEDQIIQVSANCKGHLGVTPEDCIGQPLASLIGHDNREILNGAIRAADLAPYKYTSIHLPQGNYDVVVHFYQSLKIIELEPLTTSKKENILQQIYESLRSYSIQAQQTSEIEHLYELITQQIRNITGFDRVKLYKFDESWNGAVVAESKAEHMPSYLGLHFPASDIPEQARRLYSINYLRLIPDTRYKPSPLVPQRLDEDRPALDMSHCILRSVSPIHIQYLENIRVAASMSISIMQNDRLWGLIACHHETPLHLPHNIRVLCEVIAHIFSAKLTTILRAREHRRTEIKKMLINELTLTTSNKFEHAIARNSAAALQALAADGIAIFANNELLTFGDTPPDDELHTLAAWYRERGNKSVTHTNYLGEFFADIPALSTLTGGALFVPIGVYSDDLAIWFRRATTETVNWAGNPEKPIEQTKAGYRLTPRSSFELWQSTVKGRCRSWSYKDVETADSIAQIILESSKIQADIANRAKTDFLSNMSHELRTPLGAIISIIQVLGRDKTLSHNQRKLISNLELSSDSLLSLINDLLDISKIEAKEITLEEIPFGLKELVADVQQVMSVKASEKGLQLTCNCNLPDNQKLMGDTMKLKQILFNLMNNAIKFTDRGFVNVYFYLSDTNENGTRQLTFEVIDSGIGIEEHKLEAIFDKFTQADRSTTRLYGGTGLGLSICKNLVELMGGTISVTSKPGLGSKFTVLLPVVPVPSAPGEVSAHPTHASPKFGALGDRMMKVLLAEDYEGNIIALTNYLESEGCQVTSARNGEQAIKLFQQERFDIILMDVQMPLIDGLTATRIIRGLATTEGRHCIPIIGMTANALKEDRDRCLQAGMDDYISKPLRLAELSQKMRRLTDQTTIPAQS